MIGKNDLIAGGSKKEVQIIVRLSKNDKELFKKWCEKNDTKMSKVIDNIVTKIIKDDKFNDDKRDVV